MKRNLSSQAIRAMAIGMAVTLGSATAVSGVVTGTVVNVYAANEQVEASEAKIVKDTTNVKITLKAKTGTFTSAGKFASKTEGFTLSDGKNTFTGTKQVGTVAAIQGTSANDTLEITIPIQKLTDASFKLDGSETFKLSYAKTGSSDIKVKSSGEADLTLTELQLNGKIDTVAPTISGDAEYDDSAKTITLTASENLGDYNESTSATHKFTLEKVSNSGVSIQDAITNVKVESSEPTKIVITLKADKIESSTEYKIKYTGDQIKDKATPANALVAFDKTFTTTSAPVVTAPVLTANDYDKETKRITLTSDKDLNSKGPESSKTNHGFTVKNSKTNEQSIKNVTVNNKTVTIEFTDELANDNYTVEYKKPSSAFIVATDNGELDSSNYSFVVSDKPAESTLTATTVVGTYTFEKVGSEDNEVALTGFMPAKTKVTQNSNTFVDGVLTVNGVKYTLTTIGNGTALTTLTDDALKGHTTNVIEIKSKAFENNTTVTTLSFPKVTKVGASAFKGATVLTTMDLGSQVDNKITIDANAFEGATSIKTVITNEVSKTDVTTAAQKGNPSVKVDVSISEDKYNAKDAKIEKDKFYQTKDGLLFKGLEAKDSLTFMGKKEFTVPTTEYSLDGTTEDKAYFVTFAEGKVTLQSEKGGDVQPPVEEDIFTAESNGNTLTFKKLSDGSSVALTKVVAKGNRVVANGQLANGVLTVSGKQYKLTELGDGTNSLGKFEDVVLEGNLVNVTTVKAKAFEGNDIITTITLPVVTKIEANAFDGTDKLTTIDLGSNDVTIEKDVFKDKGSSLTIKTNSETTKNNITSSGGNNVTIENPAPMVVSAEVSKNNDTSKYVLTLKLSELVFATQTPENKDFIVQNGTEGSKALVDNEVESIEVGTEISKAKDTIKLTLKNPVKRGEKVTVKYTQNITKDKQIKDTDKKNVKTLETFNENKVSVVNNSEEESAQTTTITINTKNSKVNGNTITLKTNESTLENKIALTETTGFVVKNGSNLVSVNKVAISDNNTITLTLKDAVTDNDTVKFEYTGKNDEFKADGKPVANISEITLTNETANAAPTILSGTYTKSNKGVINLTASEDLKVLDISSDFGFTIKSSNNQTTYTISNVKVEEGNKKLIKITINEDLTSVDDTLKVTYTQPADLNQIKDAKGLALENITQAQDVTAATRGIAERDDDFAVIALAEDKVEVVNGDVTGITSVKDATQEQINSILTDKLTKIEANAFKGTSNMKLDFSKVNVSNLVIDNGAFNGATGIEITNVKSSDTEKLAEMIGSSSDIKIDGKTTQEIIKDNSNSGNGGSGSGGGSSSGGSGGGSGANIGTITNKEPNTEETTSQGNNNNETVVENKQLSFDVIKLPSVEGEAKVFGDVSANHWAKSYIDKLSTAGIINGSNGMFNPNGQTKRADVTIMLVNLLGLTPEANNKFADVNASAYYAPYVGTASTYGIVNGSNGMFNPQGVISRQDTMVMIAQILKGLNLNVNADTTALSQFGDASKVSAYANESVAILVNSGIISGNNGKLNPTAPVTRAEMATIMSKLYDVLASANK